MSDTITGYWGADNATLGNVVIGQKISIPEIARTHRTPTYAILRKTKWRAGLAGGFRHFDRVFEVSASPYNFNGGGLGIPIDGVALVNEVTIIREVLCNDPASIDWTNESWVIAEAFPNFLTGNMDKYNWTRFSWQMLRHRIDLFDSSKFNWSEHSWALCVFAPNLIAQYPTLYNWVQFEEQVKCFCPEMMVYKP